jgi:hypothetical protein
VLIDSNRNKSFKTHLPSYCEVQKACKSQIYWVKKQTKYIFKEIINKNNEKYSYLFIQWTSQWLTLNIIKNQV